MPRYYLQGLFLGAVLGVVAGGWLGGNGLGVVVAGEVEKVEDVSGVGGGNGDGDGNGNGNVVTRVVYQFENPTWLENIATLSTGALLTGKLGGGAAAELYAVSPSAHTATLVHNFTSRNSVFGLGELEQDVWAVLTSNYHYGGDATGPEVGSGVLWRVDLRGWVRGEGVEDGEGGGGGSVKVEKVMELKEVGLANGLAVVNPRTVLIADSVEGNLGRVVLPSSSSSSSSSKEEEKEKEEKEVEQGAKYTILLNDPTAGIGDANPNVPLGANGLAYRAPYVYFTNCNRGTLVRVAVDPETASPTAAVEVVSDEVPVPDDLVVSEDGKTAYVTRVWGNTLEKVALPGPEGAHAKPEVVVGAQESTVIGGPTAVTWGRGKKDRRVLYVSTNGGNAEEKGRFLEGGKIVAVYLDGVGSEENTLRDEL